MSWLYDLYPHQRQLVDSARNFIAQGNKGVLIQSPPGSGKSIMIAEIIKLSTDKGNQVMFLVHRRELINQIRKTLANHNVNLDLVNIDTVIKTRNNLDAIPPPKMIVTDETHHSRAKSYLDIYNHYPDAIRLGFTATPWRLSGEGFTDIYDQMVEGQSVKWLISNHYLAPYSYFAPTLADLTDLKKASTGDYTKKSMDTVINRMVFGDVVKHYRAKANGSKAILYAHSVDASKRFAETFKEAGIEAVHADAKTPTKERDGIMERFKNGKIQILCNVDLISEGFDVPDCSCIIMVRPTASLVLYMQQSMRCMRYQKDKQAVIIDHVGNYMTHGLPDEDRAWSLEDRPKSNRANVDGPSVIDCPRCFAVIPTGSNPCPQCGEHIKNKGDNNLKQVDGELSQINGFTTDYKKIRIQRKYGKMKPNDESTLEELVLIAIAKGYKMSWIKFQNSEFKSMSWQRFNSVIKPYRNKYKELIKEK